ncbi:MAG TPA: ABC transporter substrate-binding protein [Candidatus Eisenbergiella merdipullorum]|uniref:ABC transporter substrate-binding protein n=1 Tax=Candidatus Eisenbergiella merdipullorum TaxID=2838553 RepID=A0A9D2L174_9FIRM|nr:ABC transporter substrate-binding protein [Candidatus Eisenbergiella merdipullorum]
MWKKKVRKTLAFLLAVITAASLGGCGSSGDSDSASADADTAAAATDTGADASAAETEETADNGETVNIVWRRHVDVENADEKKVEEAINAYIEPKIGVTVTIITDISNPDLSMMLAAGEEVDLFWDAEWAAGGGLTMINSNGAYDVTDLLPQYPDLYNSIPEQFWEAAKVNGRNYFIPIYKEAATGKGCMVPNLWVEKYGWDLSSIKSLYDLTPMLQQLHDDGVDYPYVTFGTGYDRATGTFVDIDNTGIGFDWDGDQTKIVGRAFTDSYKEFLDLMYSWNQAGYINSSEASRGLDSAAQLEMFAQDEIGFMLWDTIPANEETAFERYGVDMKVVEWVPGRYNLRSVYGSAYSINAKTTKVDACLKFLQLLYTDPALADLALYGIEGTHWNMDEEGRVVKVPDSGYLYGGAWCVTNVMAPDIMETEPADKKEQYAEFNASCEPQLGGSFTFDSSSVSAERAAIVNVNSEYQGLLEGGWVDPDEYLPQYQEALKNAGIDTYIAEMQRQYDEYVQSQQ